MFNRYNQYFIKRILKISVEHRLILVKHWLIFSWGSKPPPPQWLKPDKHGQQKCFCWFSLNAGNFEFIICNGCNDFKLFWWLYPKIPLTHLECIYGQSTNLRGLYSGEEGGGIFGRESTSICNLLNLLLFFLFSSIKPVFPYFTPWRYEIC